MARYGRVLQSRRQQPLRVIAPCYELAASGYYRVLLPLKVLLDRGAIEAVWKGMLPCKPGEKPERGSRLANLMAQLLNWANVYFLEREERENLIPILEKAKRLGKAIVMDIDDHVVAFPDIPQRQVSDFWKERVPYFLKILQQVDLLITTTDRLARSYKEYLGDGAETVSIPNFIDTRHPRWQVQPSEKTDGTITIGWMGGPTHIDDLELLREPLSIILNRYPKAVFKCVGLIPEWLDSLPSGQVVRSEGYSGLADYPKRFADFDIGLIPLTDNEFNRKGKSALKYLEYSMFGIASVVSKVPAYWGAVSRKRGFLTPNTTEDWIKSIETLITREALRKSLGNAAKDYVLKQRSIDGNAYRWAAAFEQARRIRRSRNQILVPALEGVAI